MNGKEDMRVKINSRRLSFHGYLEHRFLLHLITAGPHRELVLRKARKIEKWSHLKSRKPHESLEKKQGG